MSLMTFPLPLSDFFGGLRVSEATPLHLPDTRQTSRTRGGEVISASVGNRLWTGSVKISPSYHAGADAVAAKLARLTDPDASFFACPLGRAGPISDPTGEYLAGLTPKINAIAANNRELRISGLPNGLTLQTGDFLSFTYGSSPIRYAFHQVVGGGGPASSGGLSPWLEVMPPLRLGAATGTDVALVRPCFKAVAVSAGYGSRRPLISDGLAIEFVQTLR